MAETKELAPRKRGGTVGKGTRPKQSEKMSVQVEPGDNRRYLKHSLAMWDWEKPDMTDPEQVKARIVQYFQLCADDDMKPSVAGLAMAFGMDRRRLWEIVTGQSKLTTLVVDTIKKAYQILNMQMENYMQNGKINPVAGIFLMKNNMGYQDKSEVVLTPNNPLGDQASPEELRQKYLEATGMEIDDED